MTLHTHARRQATRSAFTLMEMLIVVAIIVALAGMGAYYVLPQLATSKEKLAKAGAVNVEKALTSYWTDHQQNWPNDLSALTQKDQYGGPYIEADGLMDPWGNQYQIDVSGQHHNGAKPDVWADHDGKQLGNWGR